MSEKIRFLELKQQFAVAEFRWDQYSSGFVDAGQDPLKDCNTSCTRECFTDPAFVDFSPARIIQDCVVTKCKCAIAKIPVNPAPAPTPAPAPASSAPTTTVLVAAGPVDTTGAVASAAAAAASAVKDVSAKVKETIGKNELTANDTRQRCNETCGLECIHAAFLAPFPVVEQCLEQKCGCVIEGYVQQLVTLEAERKSTAAYVRVLVFGTIFLAVVGYILWQRRREQKIVQEHQENLLNEGYTPI